jgi:hypothetical protein
MKIIITGLLILLFSLNIFCEELKIISPNIVNAGETVEFSVEFNKDKAIFLWNDGGCGSFQILENSVKVRWTAPVVPPKENPIKITVKAKMDDSIIGEGSKNIVVLGGDIISQPVFVYSNSLAPMRNFKSAPNQIKEVKYKWEVIKGNDTIAIPPEDIYKSEIRIKGKKKSVKKDDVEIKLTYTLSLLNEKKTYETIKKITVQCPTSLKVISTSNKIEEGPDLYGYTTLTTYQLLDQFNEPMAIEGIVIDEKLKMFKNPLKIPPEDFKLSLNGFVTDYEGKFVDKRYVIQSTPIPANFEVGFKQDLLINNVVIRKNEIIYKSNIAEIIEVK